MDRLPILAGEYDMPLPPWIAALCFAAAVVAAIVTIVAVWLVVRRR